MTTDVRDIQEKMSKRVKIAIFGGKGANFRPKLGIKNSKKEQSIMYPLEREFPALSNAENCISITLTTTELMRKT